MKYFLVVALIISTFVFACKAQGTTDIQSNFQTSDLFFCDFAWFIYRRRRSRYLQASCWFRWIDWSKFFSIIREAKQFIIVLLWFHRSMPCIIQAFLLWFGKWELLNIYLWGMSWKRESLQNRRWVLTKMQTRRNHRTKLKFFFRYNSTTS